MTEQGCLALVRNLYGNSSVHFIQIDGTTVLPFKSGGKFPFHGDLVAGPVEFFKKIVESILQIFSARGKTPCIVIPPFPGSYRTRAIIMALNCQGTRKNFRQISFF